MICPICNRSKSFKKEHLPTGDVVEEDGTRIRLYGEVKYIFNSINYPFKNLWTVCLYPRKAKVHHLKFLTKEEIEELSLKVGEKVYLEGCCHMVRNRKRPVVFNVRKV